MAAVGLETKLSTFRHTGLRPLTAAALTALAVTLLALGAVRLLGIA